MTDNAIKPPKFDDKERAWLSSHTKFRLGLTVDEIEQLRAHNAVLRYQNRRMEARHAINSARDNNETTK